MEEKSKETIVKKEKSNLGIQDYLSLGYIFLLVLGVFHETVYYKFLGINILEYSSVLDVLISPISVITGNLVLGLAVLFAMGLGYGYMKLIPKYYNYLGTKKKYQEGKKKAKLEKAQATMKNKSFGIAMICFYVLCMFIGLSIGKGGKTKDKINKEIIELTHQLIFEDGQKEDIKILGKNSLYVFYVTQKEREVSIAPIDGNIKIIKKLKEEE